MTSDRRALSADVVAHADWSKDPRKRFVAVARWTGTHFRAEAPRPPWPDTEFFAMLGPGSLAGFDLPIGLPREYATRAGISSFVNALPLLSDEFYMVAERPEQISVCRPFYPRVPGNTSVGQLVRGLGLSGSHDLLRACDKACDAAPLFWTLGARQPGRAAIAGWRELLAPALLRGEIVIWPFDGALTDLLACDAVTVTEVYPTEAYSRIGIPQPLGKAQQWKRAAAGTAMSDWADYYGVELAPELEAQIEDGFGEDFAGEDRFDAVAGLFGMLEVVLGIAPHVEPADEAVRDVEGWILGVQHATRHTTAGS